MKMYITINTGFLSFNIHYKIPTCNILTIRTHWSKPNTINTVVRCQLLFRSPRIPKCNQTEANELPPETEERQRNLNNGHGHSRRQELTSNGGCLAFIAIIYDGRMWVRSPWRSLMSWLWAVFASVSWNDNENVYYDKYWFSFFQYPLQNPNM